jgi:LysM repeat protein
MKRVLVGLSLVVALVGGGAAAVHAGQRHPSKPVWTHVVSPGETLWDLATAAAPGRDPRATIDRLIRDNHLAGSIIRPGQTLVLRAG